MQYINTLKVGDRVNETYFCKSRTTAMTKANKPFDIVVLQDKTGLIDAKIWETTSPGIDDFTGLDYVAISGEVTEFNGNLQLNIRRARALAEGEYDPTEYMPSSDYPIDDMWEKFMGYVDKVKTPCYKALLTYFLVDNESTAKLFKTHSAAKTVHHSFIGGLLEHSLAVTRNCDFFADNYPILKRDLLLTAAMLHDIGKLEEINAFPANDYSDEGNLLGHIVIGIEMVSKAIDQIEDFPKVKADELKHCIVAHHGELEFGSPKKPALVEAIALSFADNLDAKLETMKESLSMVAEGNLEWQKKNFFLDSIIRRTSEE